MARLHSQSCANSAVLCMMVRRLIGIPYSLVINANVAWWGGAMREKFREADFTMTHTQWLYDEVRRDFPELGREQVLRGSIGVDTESWQPPISRIRQAAVQSLLTVGRLHESKGHDYLIKALERLRSEGRPVVLRVAGTGPELSKLQALVHHYKLNDAVTFLGNLSEEDVKSEMRRAAVFILASHAEPLGVVYMEAMAMEVPTIGTDAGGVTEIIANEVDGLLVPPRDVDALAKAIARLLDDQHLSETLGKAGREKIVRRFDSRVGAEILYRRLYGRAMGETLPQEEESDDVSTHNAMKQTTDWR
jgi:glycosyltransferase involved in cell wall biosynthesis